MLLKVFMFRKLNLEKWFVVKMSLPRSGAYGLEMFCLFADWKDGELLIEILFISDFTIFFPVIQNISRFCNPQIFFSDIIKNFENDWQINHKLYGVRLL